MKKLRLTKLAKLSEKKLAKISGGTICVGCLCSGIDTTCINEDGKYAAKRPGGLEEQ